MTSTKYRPEIDGVRALAVLSVLFYHAEFSFENGALFTGGYLGVDVFFVISGYLITSILLDDLAHKRFSLMRFYERRARRILPALLTVMILSTPIAWMYLLPDALKAYAASIMASLAFGSNFLFWLEDSYIAEPSALKPFLHTWSLSVEEQFYAVYPVLLFWISRFRSKFVLALLLIGTFASLQFAQYQSGVSPDAAFYLIPARAWELLAGAILAKIELDRGRAPNGTYAVAMPTLGITLVAASFLLFDETTRHPSYASIVPVAGTMLLIWYCRAGEIVTGVLSARSVVGIGLLSYSLYLWHFPLLAFARVNFGSTLANTDKAAVLFFALLASLATYYVVESPARNRELLSTRRFLLLLSVALISIAATSTSIFFLDGVPGRLGSVAELVEDAKRIPVVQNDEACDDRPLASTCEFNFGTDRKPTLINIGDSHARSLGNALLKFAEREAYSYRQITQNGCLHIIGTVRSSNGIPNDTCVNRSEELHAYLSRQPASILVYSGRLPMQLLGSRFDNKEGGLEPGDGPDFHVLPEYADRGATISSLIVDTFQSWIDMGHTVVLIYPVPEVGWHVPRRIKKILEEIPEIPLHLRHEALVQQAISTDYRLYQARTATTRSILDSIRPHPRLIRIRPDKLFCDEEIGRCRTHNQEHLFYEDTNHVSPVGAEMITEKIGASLRSRSGLFDR